MGKELALQELPVMAILKESREMAGPPGRTLQLDGVRRM